MLAAPEAETSRGICIIASCAGLLLSWSSGRSCATAAKTVEVAAAASGTAGYSDFLLALSELSAAFRVSWRGACCSVCRSSVLAGKALTRLLTASAELCSGTCLFRLAMGACSAAPGDAVMFAVALAVCTADSWLSACPSVCRRPVSCKRVLVLDSTPSRNASGCPTICEERCLRQGAHERYRHSLICLSCLSAMRL